MFPEQTLKGMKANLGGIFNAVLPLVAVARPTRAQIKTAIAKSCNNGPGEIKGNQAVGLGLYDYITAHSVTAAVFEFDPVALGRAGRRCFWVHCLKSYDVFGHSRFQDAGPLLAISTEQRA